MLATFAADTSNRTPAMLFPRVLGTQARVSYSLDNAVGTITQLENRVFSNNFMMTGSYPTTQRVSGVFDFG